MSLSLKGTFALAGLAAGLTMPAYAGPNIVKDGSFEMPARTNYSATGNGSPDLGDGWIVTAGNAGVFGVLTINPYAGVPFDGNQELLLTDDTAPTEATTIAQSLTTTPGQFYTLTFESANELPGELLTVDFGSQSFVLPDPAFGVGAVGDYSPFSLSVFATSSATTLSFSAKPPNHQTTGVLLDAVSVTPAAADPVPEASTTASFGLLLALGMGGLIVAAKRKKTTGKASV